MRVRLLMTAATVAVLVVLAGCSCPFCGKKDAVERVALCGDCGQIKGTDVCCQPDAAKCDKCGLAKGSPGCCNITKGRSADLCRKCGYIKGSDACCEPGAAKCDKCKLVKGSPGCCKIDAIGQ